MGPPSRHPARPDSATEIDHHDLGSALTAILASVEAAHAALDDDDTRAGPELRTALAHAHEASLRAIAVFQRMR